jgi:hypothetical protein
MDDNEWKNQLGELVNFAMDCMGAAVTIIDTNGTLLYYNQHSAKVLDRKPEYIGTDSLLCNRASFTEEGGFPLLPGGRTLDNSQCIANSNQHEVGRRASCLQPHPVYRRPKSFFRII